MTNEERIEKLRKRKADYDLKASQYLMKANDIEEKIYSLMPKKQVVAGTMKT